MAEIRKTRFQAGVMGMSARLMKRFANTISLSGGWLSGASCLVSHHHSVPSQRIKKLDSRQAGFLPSAPSWAKCGVCVCVRW